MSKPWDSFFSFILNKERRENYFYNVDFLRQKEMRIEIKEVGNRALSSSRPYKQTLHDVC
jgi:hypothetical protein